MLHKVFTRNVNWKTLLNVNKQIPGTVNSNSSGFCKLISFQTLQIFTSIHKKKLNEKFVFSRQKYASLFLETLLPRSRILHHVTLWVACRGVRGKVRTAMPTQSERLPTVNKNE